VKSWVELIQVVQLLEKQLRQSCSVCYRVYPMGTRLSRLGNQPQPRPTSCLTLLTSSLKHQDAFTSIIPPPSTQHDRRLILYERPTRHK
jgi:hypothetical protein